MIMSARSLRLSSVFKFGFAASLCVFMPFSSFFGLRGLFGAPGVYGNGRPVFGFAALVIAILLGCLMPLLNAAILTLGTLILRVFRDVAPDLEARDDNSVI